MTSSNSPSAAAAGLPVQLVFFEMSIGCETCAPTRRALQQIVESESNVSLDILNLVLDKEKAVEHGVDRVPAVIVRAPGRDRIRYYGAPLGNEWPTLMAAIRMASSGETPLSEETRERLGELTKPVTLQVFFTPSCVYCPQVIALCNQLSAQSPLVSSVAIDATAYPDLVRRYSVNGVPKTIINDTVEIMGAVTEDELVAAIIRQ